MSLQDKRQDDSFNPENLRLSQDFGSVIGVKKRIITIPVRKPDRHWFVRTHPEKSMRLQTAVLELKDERETYLVSPDLWESLGSDIIPKILITSINRQGTLFLWPIRLPGADGRLDAWNGSALEASELATKKWVRVCSNMALGAYDVLEATGDFLDPEWPEMNFQEILTVAFRDKCIEEESHPVLRKLRGEL